MEKPIKGVWPRTLVSAFILFHLLVIALWGLPASKFRVKVVRWMEPYVVWIGIWHSWDMFSPDPLSLNFNVVAEITYQDGTFKRWEFPRMEKMGMWEKFQKERFRKWRERVRLDAYQAIWPDTCRWIARQHDTATNHPVSVTLTRHWGAISRPEPGKDYQPIPKAFNLPNNYLFYVYQVEPRDLQ